MEVNDCLSKATAAGKIIISGEHSAVYGRPALAMATRCKATATIHPGKTRGIKFNVPNLDYRLDFSEERLRALHEKLCGRYDEFQSGALLIDDVLDHPIELVPFAFACVWRRSDFQPLGNLIVGLDISIPIGCGMGSSAAVGICVIKAAMRYFNMSLSKQEIFEESMICERLMHGHPSGVDSSVSLYGGAFRFEDGKLEKRHIPNWNIVLMNSGKPRVSTGECVEAVRRQFEESDPIWNQFEAVTDAIDKKLSGPVDSDLIESVRLNHKLLCGIGVVPKRIQTIVAEIEAMGGAAKICGAGAVHGENAGIIMVVGDCDTDHLLKHNQLKLIEYC